MPRLTRTALAVALIVAAAAPGVLGRGYPCYSGNDEKNATALGWGGSIGVLLPSAFTGCALRCSSCLAQCAATCCCSVASPRLFSAMMTDTGPCHRRVCCGSADGVFCCALNQSGRCEEEIPTWTPKSCKSDNIKYAALTAQMQSFKEGVKNTNACKAEAKALCEGSSLTPNDDLSDEDICGWMCGYYKAKAVLGCPQDSQGDACSGTDDVEKLACKEFYEAICTGDIQTQITDKCSDNGKAITKGTWGKTDTPSTFHSHLFEQFY